MGGLRIVFASLLAVACSRTVMPKSTGATLPAGDAAFPDPRTPDVRPTLPDSLIGRTFTISANTPAPTSSANCISRGGAESLSLAFGNDISTVTLTWSDATPTVMHGTLGPESDKVSYHIDDAFAGGLLTFEWDQGVAVAQVTIYGSGVPVITCVRAPLVPQP